jgi:hypothetical protein
MIDWLVQKLFWWTPLRQAIFAEVHMYDALIDAMNEPRTNSSWNEGGLWYGYTYNKMHSMYLFDNTGHEDMSDLWDYLWNRDMELEMTYK